MTEHQNSSADSTELERAIEQLLFNKITSNRMAGFTVTVAHEIMGLVRKIGIPGAAQSVGMREALEKARDWVSSAANGSKFTAAAAMAQDDLELIDRALASQPSPAATVETDDITGALNARQAAINESMARPRSSAATEDEMTILTNPEDTWDAYCAETPEEGRSPQGAMAFAIDRLHEALADSTVGEPQGASK